MSYRIFWLRFIMAILTITLLSYGQQLEAQTLDLVDAYNLAKLNDPHYLEAMAEYKAALQKLPEAKSKLLPQVSLDAGDKWSHAKTTFGGQAPVGRGIRSWNWSVQLDQPVFHLGNDYAYYQSKHIVREAYYKFQLEKEKLILRVVKAYFNVLKANATMRESCAEIRANQFQLKSAKKAVKSGLSATTDVYEAKSHLGMSRYDFLSASNLFEDRRAQLAQLIDEWPTSLRGVNNHTIIHSPVPDNLEAWLNGAKENNDKVMQMKELYFGYIEAVKKARAGYYPRVDITASYGGNYSSGNQVNITNYSTNRNQWALGLELKMPLNLNGEQGAKVAAAVYKREGSFYKIKVAERSAETQAREAFTGVNGGLLKLKALKLSLKATKHAVAGNRIGYRMGLRTNLNVLNSQAQLYKVKRKIVKTRYKDLYNSLKLKAAAGNLSVRDLEGLNELLTHSIKPIKSCS